MGFLDKVRNEVRRGVDRVRDEVARIGSAIDQEIRRAMDAVAPLREVRRWGSRVQAFSAALEREVSRELQNLADTWKTLNPLFGRLMDGRWPPGTSAATAFRQWTAGLLLAASVFTGGATIPAAIASLTFFVAEVQQAFATQKAVADAEDAAEEFSGLSAEFDALEAEKRALQQSIADATPDADPVADEQPLGRVLALLLLIALASGG